MPAINDVNEATAQIQTLPRVQSNEKGLQAVLAKIPGEEYPIIDLFEPTTNLAIIIKSTYGLEN
jgi:hypothetical protein